MSYGSYNPGARYRQRSQKRLIGFMTSCVFFILIFGIGYWVGAMRVNQNSYRLERDKKALEEQNTVLLDDITKIRAEAQTANVRLEQMKLNYSEVMADGPVQDVIHLIREQVKSGVDPERLKNVILSARPPKNCSEPKTRRLLIVTPNYKGPESKITLEAGLITIWGNGKSAKSDKSTEEAWFDPSKPVKILFQPRDGVVIQKEGNLPLYHTQVIADKEYRFTIASDAKSFAKITYDFCDYP